MEKACVTAQVCLSTGSKDHIQAIRLAWPIVFNYWGISLAIIFKKTKDRAGVAQRVRAAIILNQGLYSFPSTHRAALYCLELQLYLGYLMPFLTPKGTRYTSY